MMNLVAFPDFLAAFPSVDSGFGAIPRREQVTGELTTDGSEP